MLLKTPSRQPGVLSRYMQGATHTGKVPKNIQYARDTAATLKSIPPALLQWAKDNPVEAGVTALTMAPVVGDAIGLGKDAYDMSPMGEVPFNMENVGWAAAGALPFVPAGIGSIKKAVSGLPMDNASKMARADKPDMFPIEAYHGTRSFFNEFDKGDIGFHFGTKEQANERLRMTRREKGLEGENIIPARLGVKSSVELPDVGQWDDPVEVALGIQDSDFGRKYTNELMDIELEAGDIRRSFDDMDDWKASPEAEDALGEIRALIRADGHDSVKYLNEAENKYGSMTGFTPEAQKQYDALNKEYHELRKKVAQRRDELPSNATIGDVEEWIAKGDPQPTKAEQLRYSEIADAQAELNRTGLSDPYSYIVLDAENARSINADFDPARRKSSNLLAGIGAGGLLAPGLMQGREE